MVEHYKGFSQSSKITDFIPCLFLRNPSPTKKILVYFHGNSEDLGGAYNFLKFVQFRIEAHIISVEYPGYGVYKGQPTESSILNDASRVLEFIQKVLKWPTKDVIALGRSIGTGPACYLASMNSLGALALISPYTSIRGIVKTMFGKISQYFIKERFIITDMIKKVKCPTFILHGKRDNIIPVEHSEILADL